MIRSIGNDQSTIGTRPSGTRSSATPFSEVFGSLASTDATASPSSFTVRHTSAGRRESVTGETAESTPLKEAIAAFKKELSLTPAERARRDVLKSMDLTEEAIEALPPMERVAVQEKVAMEVARRTRIMQGGNRASIPSITVAMQG